MFQKTKVNIGIVVLLLLVGGVLFFQRLTSLSPDAVVVSSEISNLQLDFVDKSGLVSKLESYQVIDQENVNSVNISIVQSIEEPMYTQSSPDGDLLISSSMEIEKGVLQIYISPEQYVLGLEPGEMALWLDNQFWENAQLAVKRNVISTSAEIKDRSSVFVVKR